RGDDGGDDAPYHHWPHGDVGIGGGREDVAEEGQAHEALGDAEVDHVGAELEALLPLEAVAAPRAALGHAEPAGEEVPGAAAGAPARRSPPQHAPERRNIVNDPILLACR